MALIGEWGLEEHSGNLFLHFAVEGHFLNLDTFIRTASSARQVFEALDKDFFDGSLEYELIVLPPQDGTFLSSFRFRIFAGVAVVFGYLNSPIGGAHVEGLTGYPPTYWAREFGESKRKIFINTKDKLNEISDFYSAFDENEKVEFAELIIALLTRRILEMRPEELEEVCGKKFIDASEARSEFYLACLDDRNIKAIGFSHDKEFPIRRESFMERAIKPVRSEEVEDDPPWEAHIENISVTSPNWEKNDQQSRQWKGKDSANNNCLFTIEDPKFWSLAKIKRLRVEVVDELRVQWASNCSGGWLQAV